MMQTVKDRLLEYMAVKGLRNAQVEKKAGLSNAYIRNLKNCPKKDIRNQVEADQTGARLEDIRKLLAEINERGKRGEAGN